MSQEAKPPLPLEHVWVDPSGPIRWTYCRVCLVIKKYDPAKNGPCPGPGQIRPLESPVKLDQ